jgi:hypothetical protein
MAFGERPMPPGSLPQGGPGLGAYQNQQATRMAQAQAKYFDKARELQATNQWPARKAWLNQQFQMLVPGFQPPPLPDVIEPFPGAPGGGRPY